MSIITVFPKNKDQEKAFETLFKAMKVTYEKGEQLAARQRRIKELEQDLEELYKIMRSGEPALKLQEKIEDLEDLIDIEKRQSKATIPAEQVYAEIESKWK